MTGTAGTIEMNGPLYWGDTLTIRPNPPAATKAVYSSAGFPPRGVATRLRSIPAVRSNIARVKSLLAPLRRSPRVIKCPYLGNGFTAEAADVIECIEQNRVESALSPLDDSVAMMDIMDSIRRSWSVG